MIHWQTNPQGNNSNPQCIWYSSISLSLDMTDTLLGREPKLNSLLYQELWRLQTKQRWGNASYPHLQIYSELQRLYQKWEARILAEAAKSETLFLDPSAHPTQEESKKGTNEPDWAGPQKKQPRFKQEENFL